MTSGTMSAKSMIVSLGDIDNCGISMMLLVMKQFKLP